MNIYGFTLLRNGVKYDYPFRESLLSLSGIAERIFLALGRSDDGTESAISDIPRLEPFESVWDDTKRVGGLVLSEETNKALSQLRRHVKSGWAIYLQADEALIESEYGRLREDLRKAEESGCDSLSFRYLHFWLSFDRLAYNRRWYPQEIRAVRVDSDAESCGDATTFAECKKTYVSDCTIFHYGHVRMPEAYESKKRDFGRLWHSDEELVRIQERARKDDLKEPALRYLGPHPKVMAARLERFGFRYPDPRPIAIYGDPAEATVTEWGAIRASRIDWLSDVRELRGRNPADTVMLREAPGLSGAWYGWKFGSKVPGSMRSTQAREWPRSFRNLLRLSEKGVATY